MQAISKARNLASRLRGNADTKVPKLFRPPYGGAQYFGQAYRWEQITHYKYWAFVAIKALCNEIAGGSPPNFGDIEFTEDKQKHVKKSLGGPKDHEKFVPYGHQHPICRLFRNPNGPDVAYDLWAFDTLFLSLTGESHWWIIRNGFGIPVELWVIPTHWMKLVTGANGEALAYQIQSPWGHMQYIPYEEVVSFYEHSPLNRYEGCAVSQAIGEWIDSYESMTRMRLATWKNGAVPSLHVALGESYVDPDEAFLNRWYSKWFARFQGENNSGLPLITGADIEVKGIDGHRPADALAATNQSEEHIRDMVLAAYGVPKGIVGLEPTSDVSAYAPQRQFCRFTINPKLTYKGQVITEKIVRRTPNCPNGLCFWDDRVPDDPELLERQWQNDIADGSATVNEKRTWRGRGHYPHGGNNPIVNGVEMPWMETVKEDSEFAAAFNKALREK